MGRQNTFFACNPIPKIVPKRPEKYRRSTAQNCESVQTVQNFFFLTCAYVMQYIR